MMIPALFFLIFSFIFLTSKPLSEFCIYKVTDMLELVLSMALLYLVFLFCVGEFVRLAELPCLVDLVFVRNPLEEKHSAEGTWMDEACKRLPYLKKLDGKDVHKHC